MRGCHYTVVDVSLSLNYSIHVLVRFYLITILFFSSCVGLVQAQGQSVEGTVDEVGYDRNRQTLVVKGWLWDHGAGTSVSKVLIAVDGEEHIVVPERIARPDVQQARSTRSELVGFKVSVKLNHPLNEGKHPISIFGLLDHGGNYEFPHGDNKHPVVENIGSVGSLDFIDFDKYRKIIEVRGWAWSFISNSAPQEMHISIGNKSYAADFWESSVRKDVQSLLNVDQEKLGFVARFSIDQNLFIGRHPVEVLVDWGDGNNLQLVSGQGTNQFLTVNAVNRRSIFFLSLIVTIVAVFTLLHRRRLFERFNVWCGKKINSLQLTVLLIFALVVALGVTGSSWQLLEDYSGLDVVYTGEGNSHVFKQRPIRSDEWAVLTPNTWAQINHDPAFPVTNRNLGVEGQNMGVIGMTGVPIAQPAAFGRFATWGYFFLPLQQAMSWHWYFPFFACFLVLWKVLSRFNPQGSGLNLLLSLIFCISPYAAGWSLWPLYASFFPMAIFLLLAYIFESKKEKYLVLAGGVLGLCLAGWIFTLYPPWQVTLGTFLVFLCVGWLLDRRKYIIWTHYQFISLLMAVFVAATLVGSWLVDTMPAIEQIRSTVYPGGRSALNGADLINAPWWALRGYFNPAALTLGFGSGIQSLPANVIVNLSEIGSFIFFPIPIFLLGVFLWRKAVVGVWSLRACLVFIAFALVYGFFGIPLWLSKLTLWSYVTSARLDLALGLACVVLLALIHANLKQKAVCGRLLACSLALASAALVWLAFELMPVNLLRNNSLVFVVAMVITAAAFTWWMTRGRMSEACVLLLLVTGLSTFGFNPISRSPSAVKIDTEKYAFLRDDNGGLRRVLVISDGAAPSMQLAAAGVPTVSGVFYYPHKSLWASMGLNDQLWPFVNRYQHLSFEVDPSMDEQFKVHNTQGDTVVVTVHPEKFEFQKAGAGMVVAKEAKAAGLLRNPSLKEHWRHAGWVWLQVVQ